MEDLNIIINGKRYFGKKGETVLECATREGIEIPTLCNDPRLDPYSSCYVCVVEVEKMKGLQPSCSTRISEGMVIHTDNEKVRKARKTALDLLVSNHYADCVAPCKLTCPAGVDVQGYISLIEKGMNSEAVALIKEVNPLPAICGRVCVRPCEVACRRNLLDEGTGVGIDYLKRFAADSDLASDNKFMPEPGPPSGKKVAVIGAGPGGLSAAWFLQLKGHSVDIFEASPNPGGMLRYGIPPYRLPNELLEAEVNNITELGCKIYYNKKLGENISYEDIKNNYQATVLTIGSQKGTGVGCEGDDAGNVFSGIDFLRNMEMTGQRPDFSGKTVAVVGGGNTAMDCCRTAMRLGASKVYVVYRRTEKEMPANPIEIHESKEEGIEYLFLNNPARVNKDENGNIKTLSLIKMQLGEPDASGRRRPVPVEGSEYDIEIDILLAAIGQKTQVNFIDDINRNAGKGELEVNRWGDIVANRETLQTGIENVFAAGDGVTGPATLIEAIAQARIAARSCDLYLKGEELTPEPKEFISRKDNFREQDPSGFTKRFARQMRQEMPLIPPEIRQNFNEVELGYTEEMAVEETGRCLECGCSEYFSCELKSLCDEYGAEQTAYAGGYKSYEIDFEHPYIEMDANKCILCSRCIRICRDVVGANILGLINRGFETYVAPSGGISLADTDCESCGMCISACPTGAITENKSFKPGPVKLVSKEVICNYCSVGCTLSLQEHNGFTWQVAGGQGRVNKDSNICKYGRFGYGYLNDTTRITSPLIKTNEGFKEITFDEALKIIRYKISEADPEETAFFAGARLTNEELYLIQKIARGGAGTNNISSFNYLGRGDGYLHSSEINTPFEELPQASRIYLIGSEISEENAVAGFMVNTARNKYSVPLTYVSIDNRSAMEKKADGLIFPESYFALIKAAIYYLISNGKQNSMFIKDHCTGFDEYRDSVLGEDYEKWIRFSGLSREDVESFADEYNKEQNAVIIFGEKNISGNEAFELRNLALITGKLGKTASGLICLKEKNNSQGLWDMGINPATTCGFLEMDDAADRSVLSEKWKTNSLPNKITRDLLKPLAEGKLKNFLIFGEDPLGCAIYPEDIIPWFENSDFIVVQDYFLTDTAKMADLILPSSLPMEIDGSFTNTQKVLQEFSAVRKSKLEMDSPAQLIKLAAKFGMNGLGDALDARLEALSIISARKPINRYKFVRTLRDNFNKNFNHSCDVVTQRFNEELNSVFADTWPINT